MRATVPTPATLHDLASRVGDALRPRGWFLATAESLTGGLIAATCTSVLLSSEWFECGMVTYQARAKSRLLDVPPGWLERQGAVNEPTVRAMAEGALTHSDAHLAVAVTGVAGPGGGNVSEPVGTVWIGWALREPSIRCVQTSRFALDGSRDDIRAAVVEQALRGVLELASG